MYNPTCHIRQWAKDGRTTDGQKVIVYAATCSTHALVIETTSKASRKKQIENHTKEHAR